MFSHFAVEDVFLHFALHEGRNRVDVRAIDFIELLKRIFSEDAVVAHEDGDVAAVREFVRFAFAVDGIFES